MPYFNFPEKVLPAAAAASNPPFFAESVAGLSEARGSGLLLRLVSGSGFEAGGERERLGLRSVWSKRERFAVRRSVSSILDPRCDR
jgi:hypothetical protein